VIAIPSGRSATIDDAAVAALRKFISGAFSHVPGKHIEIGRPLGRAPPRAACVNAAA